MPMLIDNQYIYYFEVKLVNPFQQHIFYDHVGMHRVPFPWWFIFPYGPNFYPPRPPRPPGPPQGPWMPPQQPWTPQQPR